MRCLRNTMYSPMTNWSQAPDFVTMIVRECDVNVPLDEVAEYQPGVLMVLDYFEVDDGTSFEAVTLEGTRRQQEAFEAECQLAVFYYWNANQLYMLNANGALANPAPAPLSTEMLRSGLEQLALNPFYKGQRVVCNSGPDRELLVMTKGEIEVTSMDGEL